MFKNSYCRVKKKKKRKIREISKEIICFFFFFEDDVFGYLALFLAAIRTSAW